MEGQRGKLYIGGLSLETSEADLVEYFSRYCEAREANIFPGRNYGFITLVDESMIDRILGEEHVILGRRVRVNRARRRNNVNLGYNFCQNVFEVAENRERPRNNRNERSVLGYDFVCPSCPFYNPSPHFCARPFMIRHVQFTHYNRVYEVGEPSCSPSSVVPSCSAPVSAVTSPCSEGESTVPDNLFDCAQDFSNGVSTETKMEENEDFIVITSEVEAKYEEDKVEDELSLSCNGGNPYATQSNMEENEEDLAISSEVSAKFEEEKVEDGVSLSCNGGKPL